MSLTHRCLFATCIYLNVKLGSGVAMDDKGDQPSGGETTWKHTGATRYGKGQHNTG